MDHFQMIFSNAFRSGGSLLRTAKRHFIDAVQEAEAAPKQEREAQQAAASGDVERTTQAFEEFIEQLYKALTELEDTEEKTVVAEERSEQELADLRRWFDLLIADVKNATRLDEAMRTRLVREFTTIKERTTLLMQNAYGNLKDEYLKLEREYRGEERLGAELATGGLKAAMDELWKLRGKYRRERRKEKTLEQEAHALHEELRGLDDEEQRQKLIEKITKEEEALVKEFTQFEKLLAEMIEAYNLIIKVALYIFFRLKHEAGFAERFLHELEEAGFPTKEREEMARILHAKEGSLHERLGRLLNAMRWGRHKVET